MLESLLSLGLVVLFCIVGWAFGATTEALVRGGVGLVALGFAYGIPAAIVYHWLLYRSLSRCDRLPGRWWLHPTTLHDRVPSGDRRGVLAWGAIGGTGFIVIVIGIVLTSIGLWRMS
ncbi:MAG TPA: hypothetical protein ENI85_01125 [Deltaproteobacteria bacterium]|nr:hypothetical protein [Deltaproteobacteria bacterium]